jgi:hypothetical protein
MVDVGSVAFYCPDSRKFEGLSLGWHLLGIAAHRATDHLALLHFDLFAVLTFTRDIQTRLSGFV